MIASPASRAPTLVETALADSSSIEPRSPRAHATSPVGGKRAGSTERPPRCAQGSRSDVTCLDE
jgi:hypothetical protein